MEYRIHTEEGQEKWIKQSGRFIIQKGELIQYSYFIDITHTHELEERLKQEKERNQVIVSFFDDVYWEYDIAERRMIYPGNTNSVTGLASIPDFRVTMLALNAIYPQDVKRFQQFCDKMDSGRKEIDLKYRIRKADEEYKWFSVKAFSLF